MEPRPSHQASHQEQAGGSCDHEAPLQRDQRAEEYLLDLLCELGLRSPSPNSADANKKTRPSAK